MVHTEIHVVAVLQKSKIYNKKICNIKLNRQLYIKFDF